MIQFKMMYKCLIVYKEQCNLTLSNTFLVKYICYYKTYFLLYFLLLRYSVVSPMVIQINIACFYSVVSPMVIQINIACFILLLTVQEIFELHLNL